MNGCMNRLPVMLGRTCNTRHDYHVGQTQLSDAIRARERDAERLPGDSGGGLPASSCCKDHVTCT